jgi:hypothetical protein
MARRSWPDERVAPEIFRGAHALFSRRLQLRYTNRAPAPAGDLQPSLPAETKVPGG